MLKSKALHNNMLFEAIKRKGERSKQYETIQLGAPLTVLMEGKSYVKFYKENYANLAFKFKVDEDMILI